MRLPTCCCITDQPIADQNWMCKICPISPFKMDTANICSHCFILHKVPWSAIPATTTPSPKWPPSPIGAKEGPTIAPCNDTRQYNVEIQHFGNSQTVNNIQTDFKHFLELEKKFFILKIFWILRSAQRPASSFLALRYQQDLISCSPEFLAFCGINRCQKRSFPQSKWDRSRYHLPDFP